MRLDRAGSPVGGPLLWSKSPSLVTWTIVVEWRMVRRVQSGHPLMIETYVRFAIRLGACEREHEEMSRL